MIKTSLKAFFDEMYRHAGHRFNSSKNRGA